MPLLSISHTRAWIGLFAVSAEVSFLVSGYFVVPFIVTREFALPVENVGFVWTSFAVGTVIGTFVQLFIADRVSKVGRIAWISGFRLVMMVPTVFSRSFLMFLILFTACAVPGSCQPLVRALFAEEISEAEKTKFFSIMTGVTTATKLLAMTLSGILANAFGDVRFAFATPLLMTAILVVFSATCLCKSPSVFASDRKTNPAPTKQTSKSQYPIWRQCQTSFPLILIIWITFLQSWSENATLKLFEFEFMGLTFSQMSAVDAGVGLAVVAFTCTNLIGKVEKRAGSFFVAMAGCTGDALFSFLHLTLSRDRSSERLTMYVFIRLFNRLFSTLNEPIAFSMLAKSITSRAGAVFQLVSMGGAVSRMSAPVIATYFYNLDQRAPYIWAGALTILNCCLLSLTCGPPSRR